MAQFSRTWWGTRFIEALERFTDPGRLGRGRSYASGGKILKYDIVKGKVSATVRGSINPYYGIYEEPRYTTTIALAQISAADWAKVIKALSFRAGFVAKLLMNEMPDNIEDAFSGLGLHLLPQSRKEFKTHCSCPDDANPCKHIAGVYYLVARELDRDPFLLFALRGLSKEDLQKELTKSPLGQILSAQLDAQKAPVEPVSSYYTEVAREKAGSAVDLREFWAGSRRLPTRESPAAQAGVAALLIKKQGDYPPFWHKDGSFIGAMEDLYERVRAKNREVL